MSLYCRKFCYFCVDIIDSPSSNLLQYLPRVVKFINEAIKNDGIVYIHCVHGQSRSCAVCVAYLMQLIYQTHNIDFLLTDNNKNHELDFNFFIYDVKLLHLCYSKVMHSRPQMAINPGFVKQLEIFRQMKGAQYLQSTFKREGTSRESEMETNTNVIPKLHPLQSKAHAYFRSFRSKSEFQYTGCINSTKFSHLITPDDKSTLIYKCLRCHENLFTEFNIIQEFTEDQISKLPISDYWRESQGGIEYMNSISSSNSTKSNSNRNIEFESALSQVTKIFKLEPMMWMNTVLCDRSNHSGNLCCPGCSTHLGYWDWMNKIDLPTAIIVLKNKLCEKRTRDNDIYLIKSLVHCT